MLTYSPSDEPTTPPRVAIIGLGGAGSNVLHLMEKKELPGCSLYSVNLDIRLLESSGAPHKIHLGSSVTHGLGSGGDPQVGAQAARESEASLVRALEGCSLAVMIAGLGGGTGSGAAPVIARLAKELGVFLVSVVTMPFDFEGPRRSEQARAALAELALYSDILVPFDNEKMADLVSADGSVLRAFDASNRLLMRAAEAVPMLHGNPGLVRLGLDDLRTVMAGRNRSCLFGFGTARGGNKAVEAARQVMESPFLATAESLRGVSEVLVHVTGGELLGLDDIRKAMDEIARLLPGRMQVHFGVSVCPEAGDELRLVLFASTAMREHVRKPLTESAFSAEATEVVSPVPAPVSLPAVPEDALSRSVVAELPADEPVVPESPVQEPVIIIHSDIDPGAELELRQEDPEPPSDVSSVPHVEVPAFSFEPSNRTMAPSPRSAPQSRRSRFEKKVEAPAVTPPVAEPLPVEEEEDSFDKLKEIFVEKSPAEIFAGDSGDSTSSDEAIDPLLPEEEEDEDGKGLFSNVDAFIVDGEDLDLPPFMRKKK